MTTTLSEGANTAATRQPRLVALVVAVAFFMQMLDGTIITTSLPQMALSFGVEPVAMSVGITIYMLSMAVFIPLSGWLGDRYGSRNVFITAIGIFTIASLACGLSDNLWQFVGARAVQGIGSALMTPVGRMIVLRNAEKSELVSAIALITWPALFAPVIGPVLGSFITTWFSWHWNFFINIPLGVIGILLMLKFVPDYRDASATKFDRKGFALSAAGLALLLSSLESFAHGMREPYIASVMLVAGGTLSVLAARHLLGTRYPLLDLSVFGIRTFALATATAGTAGRVSINSAPFLLPLLFQVGFGFSAIKTGTFILVYFAGNLGMKVVTTPLLRRFGFRSILCFNGLIASLSLAACSLLSATTPEFATFGLLLVAGLSRSMQFTALNTLTFADINAGLRSSASTLSSMLQQMSMLLGVALSAFVLNLSQVVHGNLTTSLTDFRTAFFIMGFIGVVSALRFLRLESNAGAEVSGHVLKV
ncbi:MFS transporter [Phyllobacterium sp. SB3]|uniref:MFS transporter n=1 Tax=Phyllobacterium sp. SB3 TaxID=3156073 RepID=UPI0032AEC0C5